MEIPEITQLDYEKLSDDLYYLGNSIKLRFNVVLAKKGKEGNRVFFQKDYRYMSKYDDYGKVITMRRSFDYYLSLDKSDLFGSSVMIRVQDIILVRMKMQEVLTWFNAGIFKISKGELKLIRKPEPIRIDGLPGGKFLMFEPIVIEDEITRLQQEGVRITLTEPNVFCDVSIDRFYGLFYLINSINMYQSAQLLINYIGHPEFGTNMSEYTGGFTIDEQDEPDVQMKDRKPPTKKGRSYFDRIDEL